MFTRTIHQSPRNRRGGQVSYLLLSEGRFGSRNLSLTWVEGEPGSEQPLHAHPTNEQAYVIVQGKGLMTAGQERQEVGAGTVVYVPPSTSHAIRNVGTELLIYVSATSPPFELPPPGSPFEYR